ncbi:alpha/beta hydrolase [Haladaptatus sp. AB618]|uniref:alpha/beta hydrolase n=1 Tax=Haladaptatus sp. AB618 TaxID=2934173 RepID=UPI00209C357F|nr:alpha/beta hydrolase [Haladaptatus sp. AB618]MCO8255487.1 alpha/beta hydrolase [Haladaptatus sp. AB618]
MTTFVLIHGAWLTPRSWEGFEEYLSERGHEVIVPAWPGHDRPVEEIRADPSPIDGLTLQEIVDHYADVIRDLPEQPVLVGHSFGALIVQLLLDRGFGAAGVAIDTAPPKGVRLPLSSLRTAWPVLSNPANRNRTVELSFEQFKYAFVNTWPDDDARAAYDRYAVPETGRIFFQAGTSSLTPNAANTVDYGNDDRPPLLLVVGERDHTSPPSLSRSINRKYGRSRAVTDLHEFVGRSHLLMVGDGWKEIAEDVERWADRTLPDGSHTDRP